MEGEISYQKIPHESFNDVIKHLRDNFFADEPINRSLDLCERGEPQEELEAYSLNVLEHRCSFMATYRGQVVGVLLNAPGDKEINCEIDEKKPTNDSKVQTILNFFDDCNKEVDIPKLYQTTRILDLKVLSVDHNMRGHGIAKKLLTLVEDFAQISGYELLRADATSFFSQQLFIKNGFEVVKEVKYNDYTKNNQPLFNVALPHESLKIMAKKLSLSRI